MLSLRRVHGTRPIEAFENVLDEFLEEHADITYKGALEKPGPSSKEETKKLILQSLEAMEASPQAPQRVSQKAKPAWDCESFLSTYSNLENHPGLIRERPKKQIVLNKSGIPKVFEQQGSKKEDDRPTAKVEGGEEKSAEEGEEEEEDEDGSGESEPESTMSVAGAARPKNETAEERKERKKAVKDQKKARRQEKKSTKNAFKTEKLRQEKFKIQTAATSPQVVHIS